MRRTKLFLALAFLAATLLAADFDAYAQSKRSESRHGHAMHPKHRLQSIELLNHAPLSKTQVDALLDGSYVTYVGGDTVDRGIASHEFPNGDVFIAVQTSSKGLPVTSDAEKEDHSGNGDDIYRMHFNQETGEIYYASYSGDETQDWLSGVICNDSDGSCFMVGGRINPAAAGKTQGDDEDWCAEWFDLYEEIGIEGEEDLVPAYRAFCLAYDQDPGDLFSFFNFLFATIVADHGDDSAAPKSQSIWASNGACGFRNDGDNITGIFVVFDPFSCQVGNVLESTYDTDDTFYSCYAGLVEGPEPGKDPSQAVTITAVGVRDNNADLALADTTIPTMCWASVDATSMTCADMPAAAPLAKDGSLQTSQQEFDQYTDIVQDPNLGTFAAVWNSSLNFSFIDYWPSVDPEIISTTAPQRLNAGNGFPSRLSVSPSGFVSFAVDFVSSQTYFGQLIGSFFVNTAEEAGTAGKAGAAFNGLDFQSFHVMPGGFLTRFTFDLNSYPHSTAFSAVAFGGVETAPEAVQSECPNGDQAVCALFGHVNLGFNYVSACNMTDAKVDAVMATTVPEATSQVVFGEINDVYPIEPHTCSRMWPWPQTGSFDLRLVPEGGDTVDVDFGAEAPGSFATVLFDGDFSTLEVEESPASPRTHSVYFVNGLDEEVTVRVYDAGGVLYSATLAVGGAGIFNAASSDLDQTVFVEAVAATDGVAEVVSLDLPSSDFLMQTVVAPTATRRGQTLLEILTFDALGLTAESNVVTSAERLTELPERLILHGNYPNPFNPSTTVRYELPQLADVELTVINVFGQTIRTIDQSQRPAGVHEVTWDGRNDGGVPVASGVYLYTIKAGDQSLTQRMTLLK